jgi:hypothetical protein
VGSPCINTDIDLDEVEEILKKLYYKEWSIWKTQD